MPERQIVIRKDADMADWIIGLIIAAAVAAVIVKKVKDIRAGKSGCGCGCSGCGSSCPGCAGDSGERKKN